MILTNKDWWETSTAFHMKFTEPHKDGHFYISSKRLKELKESGKKLIVEYKDRKVLFSYKKWMDGALFMSKPFLFKDRPMKLWGQVLSKGVEYTGEPPKVENVMGSLFTSMPEIYLNQIKAKLGRT